MTITSAARGRGWRQTFDRHALTSLDICNASKVLRAVVLNRLRQQESHQAAMQGTLRVTEDQAP